MADDSCLITLKILSPSTEVNGDIVFRQLPATTTVKALKQRIQNEISTKPSVERMRLIYRGRVVADDQHSMSDVFGPDNVHNSTEHTLHLVLRELANIHSSTPVSRAASSPAPRSSTAPPQNPFRPVPTIPQTNPFRNTPIPQPRPNSQPHIPNPHHHHHHHHHHQSHVGPPLQGPNPFPPIPPEIFQQHIAQAMAHSRAHFEQHNHAHTSAQGQNSQQNNLSGDTQEGPQGSVASGQPQAEGNEPHRFLNRVPTPSNLGIHGHEPGSTRTIRHEAIGPNGQRWTMTMHNNVTIPGPAGIALPGPPQRSLTPQTIPLRPLITPSERDLLRMRTGLQGAERELENVYILMRTPTTTSVTPTWRDDQIRHHLASLMRSLDQLQSALAPLAADPHLGRNSDVLSMQMLHSRLRGQAVHLQDVLNSTSGEHQPTAVRPEASATTPQAPSASRPDGPSTTAHAPTSPAENSESQTQSASTDQPLAESGPELFLLSSPQGPVGVLFDERGTYSTAPFAPLMPYQAFNQRFAANRQLLSSLGHRIAQNPVQTNDNLAARQPQPVPDANQQAQAQAPLAAAQGAPLQNQNPAERLQVNLGLLWFLVKLGFFIYIFAGNGGWYRPIMMCCAGVLIYLAQVGMFQNHFDRIRRHFEALLPVADRPRAGHNNAAPGQPQAPPNQGDAGGREPGRNLSPQEAAQRLVREHQHRRLGWIRESTRSVERSLAIFVASLWPGLGERMVRAQEERERAERAAEEERRREEEEQAAREDQGQQPTDEPNAQAVGESTEVAAQG